MNKINNCLNLKEDQIPLFFLLIFAIWACFYNISIPLHGDEAYYWVWSKHLDASYYDGPSLIAWLIRLVTFIFGDNVFGVRFLAVFCMSFSAIFVYILSKELIDQKAAFYILMIFLTAPASTMGYTIVTLDSPLMLFWSTSLYFAYKAIFYNHWKYYIVCGLSIGLMMLSKYNAVLFYGVLVIYLAIYEPKKFLNIKPWTAVLISLVIFSPILIWNYLNDFIGFSFQYSHGTSSSWQIKWAGFFEFFFGLFVIVNPIFFSFAILASLKVQRYWHDRKKAFIAISFLFPLFFFLYKGLFKTMALNWPIVSFIGGIIFTGNYLYERKMIKSIWVIIAFSLLLSLTMRYPMVFGLRDELNIHNRVFGLKEAALQMEKYREKDDIIGADHLTTAAMLKFYLKGNPKVIIPTHSRYSQYSIWDKGLNISKKKMLYLSKNNNKLIFLKQICKNITFSKTINVEKDGFLSKDFFLYRCILSDDVILNRYNLNPTR